MTGRAPIRFSPRLATACDSVASGPIVATSWPLRPKIAWIVISDPGFVEHPFDSPTGRDKREAHAKAGSGAKPAKLARRALSRHIQMASPAVGGDRRNRGAPGRPRREFAGRQRAG